MWPVGLWALAYRCLYSADRSSTRWSTLGDCAFPVACIEQPAVVCQECTVADDVPARAEDCTFLVVIRRWLGDRDCTAQHNLSARDYTDCLFLLISYGVAAVWLAVWLGPVSTWMGDRLWAGKLSRYVTSHPGQLSLAIPPWVGVGVMSTSLGWERNRRSGVALAMRHRQQWFIHLRAQRPMKGRWAPRLRSFWSMALLYVYLCLQCPWHDSVTLSSTLLLT